MTANELADLIEDVYPRGFVKDAADLLRQQAKEIAMLKQIIDANNLQSDIGQFVKPTDPYEKGFIDGMQKQMQSRVQQMVEGYAQLRELTDEEIESAWFKVFKPESGIGKNITNGVYEFARTILRKAQEKRQKK
jgi:cytoskeletal protein RodZ